MVDPRNERPAPGSLRTTEGVRVVYILGPSRTGSTLLGNILGEMDGFFVAGELIDIWDRGLRDGGLCGCGTPVSSCPVWRTVMERVFTGNAPDVASMIRWRDVAAHSYHVPWMLTVPSAERRLARKLEGYRAGLAALYDGIRAGIGCRCIVDTSKNVGYAHVLTLIPGVEVYGLHLVRDPRATAFSWSRPKPGLRQEGPATVVRTWVSRNVSGEWLGRRLGRRYLRILYEDLVREPERVVLDILDFVGESPAPLSFLSGKEVELSPNHSVYGNPNRFSSGSFEVRDDDRWRAGMRFRDRWLVTALSWPWLRRYGYPLGIAKGSDGRRTEPA